MDRSTYGVRSPLTNIANASLSITAPPSENNSPPLLTPAMLNATTVVDDTSPLPNPPFPLPSLNITQIAISLTYPSPSTSWLPLRQNASFGARSPSLHSPLTFCSEGVAHTL